MSDDKKYKLSDFAFRIIMGKDLAKYDTNPPHVRAARILEEHGHKIKADDVIEYIMSKDGAMPVQYATFSDIDWSKYIEYYKSMVKPVLEVLDLDFDEIISGRKQLRLDEIKYEDACGRNNRKH